jgi:hypothetical protein
MAPFASLRVTRPPNISSWDPLHPPLGQPHEHRAADRGLQLGVAVEIVGGPLHQHDPIIEEHHEVVPRPLAPGHEHAVAAQGVVGADQ